MRVLLAEDNASHRELLEILIRSGDERSRVTAVETGTEFLNRLKEADFDVALLDFHLSDYDASALLPQIDEIPNRPPVVIISSDCTSDTIISALRSGGRDFLPKDEAFEAGGLIKRIRAALQRRHLEQRLIEQQKDECISALAGGLAHDFNNMLVGILGKAALLRDTQLNTEKHRQYCDGIMRTAERLADLSKQLLAYARGGKYNAAPVNVNDAIEDTLAMLTGAIAKPIKVRPFLGPDLWHVEADRSQLVQALLNLCLNACEAMGGVGTLSIFTENSTKDLVWTDDLLKQHPAGEYVHIVVADTGCGIPDDHRREIFEPYFSTKGDGRGLGLAAVKGIVTTHGGALLLNSDIGSGSAFHILLPRLRTGQAVSRKPDVVPKTCAANILVVEDEQEVREVIGEILQLHGHRVTFAEDGATARRRLQANNDGFDLVLLDMRLPDCSGADLLKTIKAEAPNTRIILCSGYERVSVMEDLLVHHSDVPFLAKPFQPHELLTLVANRLTPEE